VGSGQKACFPKVTVVFTAPYQAKKGFSNEEASSSIAYVQDINARDKESSTKSSPP
jgi:hypothetical protein